MKAKVKDVMTRSLITIAPDAVIHEARRLMERHRLSALPVVDEAHRPVGVVSATDLLANLHSTLPVNRVMTEEVFTIEQDHDVGAAAKSMRTHAVHRLIVVENQMAVGVVSALDLLQFVA
jgi:CBS domain-containing protein